MYKKPNLILLALALGIGLYVLNYIFNPRYPALTQCKLHDAKFETQISGSFCAIEPLLKFDVVDTIIWNCEGEFNYINSETELLGDVSLSVRNAMFNFDTTILQDEMTIASRQQSQIFSEAMEKMQNCVTDDSCMGGREKIPFFEALSNEQDIKIVGFWKKEGVTTSNSNPARIEMNLPNENAETYMDYHLKDTNIFMVNVDRRLFLVWVNFYRNKVIGLDSLNVSQSSIGSAQCQE